MHDSLLIQYLYNTQRKNKSFSYISREKYSLETKNKQKKLRKTGTHCKYNRNVARIGPKLIGYHVRDGFDFVETVFVN